MSIDLLSELERVAVHTIPWAKNHREHIEIPLKRRDDVLCWWVRSFADW